MPELPTRRQQPKPVPPQVPLPTDFPAIPDEVIKRFPSAQDWQRRLNEFWTRTTNAVQQVQQQTASQVNSTVIWTVDRFLIYTNNGGSVPMFALDDTGVRLGNVLVINTPGRKVYIGAGVYADDNTPFYIDVDGKFSLGANLTWDPDTATLTITGIINATSGTIGGFSIGTDYIRDVANSFGLASTVTGGDDVRFWAGATFANRATALFRIYESGVITVGSGASYQYNNVRMISAITALNNIFLGPSGNFTMTGNNNFSIGTDALISNTDGTDNLALGINALNSNTSGSYNLAAGSGAMLANIDGDGNTAYGLNSLAQNIDGSYNTAIGYNALGSNSSGWYNVAIGYAAMVVNTTGYGNIAIGVDTIRDLNITANDGSGNNTAVGYSTGLGIVTGVNNTILGANVTGLGAALSANIILANGTGAIKAQHDGTNWVFTGGATISALAGVGTRAVVASAAGVLSAP